MAEEYLFYGSTTICLFIHLSLLMLSFHSGPLALLRTRSSWSFILQVKKQPNILMHTFSGGRKTTVEMQGALIIHANEREHENNKLVDSVITHLLYTLFRAFVSLNARYRKWHLLCIKLYKVISLLQETQMSRKNHLYSHHRFDVFPIIFLIDATYLLIWDPDFYLCILYKIYKVFKIFAYYRKYFYVKYILYKIYKYMIYT